MHHVFYFLGVLILISSCVTKKNKEVEVSLSSGKAYLINDESTSLYTQPKAKKLSKQLAALRAEIASDKRNVEILNRIVDTLFFLKKYDEAINYAKKILMIEGSNTKIRLKIAHAAVRLRKYSFAEFIISQLPCAKDSDCLNLMGVIAYHQGKIKEALDYYKRALTLSTNNLSATLNLALLYMEFYKFGEALAEVKRILKLSPRDKHAKLIRAVLFVMNKKLDKAEDLLEGLYSKHKTNPVILHNMSAYALKTRDYDKALKLINRALKYSRKHSFSIDKSIRLKEEIGLKKKSGG